MKEVQEACVECVWDLYQIWLRVECSQGGETLGQEQALSKAVIRASEETRPSTKSLSGFGKAEEHW